MLEVTTEVGVESDRNGMRRPAKQGNELYVDERGTREMAELSLRETESVWPSVRETTQQRNGGKM